MLMTDYTSRESNPAVCTWGAGGGRGGILSVLTLGGTDERWCGFQRGHVAVLHAVARV